MKAEHRRELHTNVLADRMGRLVQGMKKGPKSNSSVAWAIAVLALGLLIAWYYTGRSQQDRSTLWIAMDGANDLTMLERISRDNPGTIPGRTARFKEARLFLQRGLRSLYSDQRSRAVENVEHAQKLYEQLSKECRDDLLLVQEAYMGVAQSAESLGLMDDARDNYLKVIDANLKELGKKCTPAQALDCFERLIQENLQQVHLELVEQINTLEKEDLKRGRIQTVLLLLAQSDNQIKDSLQGLDADTTNIDALLKVMNGKFDEVVNKPVESIKVYQKLAESLPQAFGEKSANVRDITYRARKAALRVDALVNNPEQIDAFYRDMNRRAEEIEKYKNKGTANP